MRWRATGGPLYRLFLAVCCFASGLALDCTTTWQTALEETTVGQVTAWQKWNHKRLCKKANGPAKAPTTTPKKPTMLNPPISPSSRPKNHPVHHEDDAACMGRCPIAFHFPCSDRPTSAAAPPRPAVAPSTRASSATGRDTLRVRIWQGERGWGMLKFMYSPATSSLRRLLTAAAAAASQPISVDFRASNSADFGAVERGDLFIWVGIVNLEAVPFRALAARGVHTVFYQSEPLKPLRGKHGIGAALDAANEIWDYSQENIDFIRKTHSGRRIGASYVPITADPSAPVLHPSNHSEPLLLFLGNPGFRKEKWRVLSADGRISKSLVSRYNIWSRSSYDSLLLEHSSSIFLNIHKEHSNALESFRIADLLSRGALVVSEKSSRGSEQEYADLVDFVALGGKGGIADVFLALKELHASKRQALGDKRRGIFAKRFGACHFSEIARRALCRAWCLGHHFNKTAAARKFAPSGTEGTAKEQGPSGLPEGAGAAIAKAGGAGDVGMDVGNKERTASVSASSAPSSLLTSMLRSLRLP